MTLIFWDGNQNKGGLGKPCFFKEQEGDIRIVSGFGA